MSSRLSLTVDSPKTVASSISRLWGSPTSPQGDLVPRSMERLTTTMGCLSTVLDPNMDNLAAPLDPSPRTVSLSLFRSGSDYRSGLGEMAGGSRPGLASPTGAHSLSPTTLSDIDGTVSRAPNGEDSSASRDGTSVPLLRTESIRLQDLDRTLLAEVKDVLIPHEQVVIHTDQVIGKGVDDRLGGGAGA